MTLRNDKKPVFVSGARSCCQTVQYKRQVLIKLQTDYKYQALFKLRIEEPGLSKTVEYIIASFIQTVENKRQALFKQYNLRVIFIKTVEYTGNL